MDSAGSPVVFLDRDNTLIANDGDLGDPAQVRLLPGVADGLRTLKEAGFRLVVVTNQGGVARGRYTERDVDLVHARIAHAVDEAAGATRLIDRFYYCPFHPEATVPAYRREHAWRKPQPGMLLQAAQDLHLDLDRGWMIGDKPRDTAAGRAAGVRTVLVGHTPNEGPAADFTSPTFAAAVELVLAQRGSDGLDAARRAAARAKSLLEMKPAYDDRSAAVATAAPSARRTKRSRIERDKHQRTRQAKTALEPLRRALLELVEEVRSDRTRRGELSPMRIAAGVMQLATIVCAVFALLELADLTQFGRWLGGALLTQLATIALLLFDRH
ncbi:MAG: HAD family hydrolase [Phycisphaerae bacterium]|nr:HAD family hydrolase [Phycisphaerae bacterium]